MEADDSRDDPIALTKAVRTALRAERSRTGVTAIQLLSDADDLPDGLTAGHVNRWMNGLVRSAPKIDLDYVLARWAALPDGGANKRGKVYPTATGAWIDVTEEMSAHLRAELVRTAVDHATMLDGVSDRPRGLNARIIKGWLYKEARTTRAAHWGFIIATLAALPDGRRQWTETNA